MGDQWLDPDGLIEDGGWLLIPSGHPMTDADVRALRDADQLKS